jgi:hypothetical protein
VGPCPDWLRRHHGRTAAVRPKEKTEVTRITHVRCDRCGKDMAHDTTSLRRDRDWAYCQVDLEAFDFCPDCWRAIMKFADVEFPLKSP